MSGSREERDVSVTEAENQYVSTTDGPVDDTIVHTRETPGIVPGVEHVPAGPVARDVVELEGPNIRKSMRKPEEVEKHRVLRTRKTSPLFVSFIVFLMVLAVGSTALWLILTREDRAPPPAPPPPPAEIGGVPVRNGMKGTVD